MFYFIAAFASYMAGAKGFKILRKANQMVDEEEERMRDMRAERIQRTERVERTETVDQPLMLEGVRRGRR
jgi:hypothetical protein